MKDPAMIQHESYLNDIERLASRGRRRPARLPIAGLVTCLAAAGLVLPFIGG